MFLICDAVFFILFDVKAALQYNPINSGTSSQGASYFTSKNPPYGAIFTYNLPDSYKSVKDERKKKEKELHKLKKDIPFPGWEALDREISEAKVEAMKGLGTSEKEMATREKEGVFAGKYAINPVNGDRVPIYVGNFVLMGFGTGVVMAVPTHDQRDFEFAKKYDLPIIKVIDCHDNDLIESIFNY